MRTVRRRVPKAPPPNPLRTREAVSTRLPVWEDAGLWPNADAIPTTPRPGNPVAAALGSVMTEPASVGVRSRGKRPSLTI